LIVTRLRAITVALYVMLALGMSTRAQSDDRSTCLCEREEVRYFSCQTARGKAIALCGRDNRFVQYRFGKRGKIELQFPASVDSPETLRYASYMRFETESYEVTFTSSGVRYSIFDYTEGKERSAGVRVTNASGNEVVVACAGKIYSRLSQLESRLPCDADNALNLDGCPQQSDQ
jgi:hypothetical protein